MTSTKRVVLVTIGALAVGAGSAARGGAAESLTGPVAALEKARATSDIATERAERIDTAALSTDADSEPAARTGSGRAPAASGRAVLVPSATQAVPLEGRQYDPAQHRDPFTPPAIATDDTEEDPKTPLERYELGQLRLVGVVWDFGGARAMVEDSAGLGYILIEGTPIGLSGGVVRAIEPHRVLIEESTIDFYGDVVPREFVMELPREEGSP